MGEFPDIDTVHQMLDEIAETLPVEFFNKLNEGVVLLPQHKYHPKSRSDRRLYVMGEYHKSITGSHIRIYYGSFKRVFGGITLRTPFCMSLHTIWRHWPVKGD
jgi:hypothetical protein